MKCMNTLVAICAAVGFLAGPSTTALAQPVDPMDDAELRDTSQVDKELDLYWARKRDIRTIQKRLFLKEARWEFTLYGGTIPNDEFFQYFPLGLRAGHFFTEDLAAELWGSYIFNTNSELEDFLETNFPVSVEIPQTLKWMAGAAVTWSPIHGKFAIFTSELSHFDLHVAFGAGVIATDVIENHKLQPTYDVSGNVGLGFRVYITDLITARFDYRQYFYPSAAGGVAHPAELTLGLSFFTPAPQ